MKRTIITAIAAATFATAAHTQGSDVCMPAPELKASLIDWYAERPVEGQKDLKQQLWASEQTGSWTVVKFFTDGRACVMAQGTRWSEGVETEELLALATQ